MTPKSISRKDYQPPAYLVKSMDLHFDLHEDVTVVQARLIMTRNKARGSNERPLILFGRGLVLTLVALDGRSLTAEEYAVDAESLTIHEVPVQFTLEISTRIKPQENTALEGLYKSEGMFCTQCEAEGFRKITYFPDRPDVMATFTTTIVADKIRYPVLLSNGNLVEHGNLAEGRHFATWQDPFPKPSYLFALVAGDLGCVEGTFITRSSRSVALRIFVRPAHSDKCDHAMHALKQAMRWDEEVYGREYDLDIYMIVAVDDFNMGAMENKGLNIFNTACVLARPETATDGDYQWIEAVIAHEYFHNWTGNRITLRDWFQLSLKEGLTVFRDQQFSADMISGSIKRIGDVRDLRNRQFPEDAGPMAHPVRPDSYIEINNFYTATVYNKGAEVVRMLYTLLGKEGFRRGMDLYFARHDGQAVTTDDFVQAMADANDADFSQFERWYSQAGTPELWVESSYDPTDKVLSLKIRQTCPLTPGQPHKEPFFIPMAMGLLTRDGRELPLQLEEEPAPASDFTRVLVLKEETKTFRFVNVPSTPVPSLLRGFSAPVRLHLDYSPDDLLFLWAHDPDPFNRWDAGQELACRLMLGMIADFKQGRPLAPDKEFVVAFADNLRSREPDKALLAATLILPAEIYLAELMDEVDVDAIHNVREFVRKSLAEAWSDLFLVTYHGLVDSGPYSSDPATVGRRSLKNLCLAYLMTLNDRAAQNLCLDQFYQADNMTDALGALAPLSDSDCPEREEVLAVFYRKWQHEPLVVDKWFAIQALSGRPDTLSEVRRLMRHPAFRIENPNKVRALIRTFCQNNPVRFHDASGAGYAFLGEQVLVLDRLNPQIAARMLAAFGRWRKFAGARREMMRNELERIAQTPGISRAVYEIAYKSLG